MDMKRLATKAWEKTKTLSKWRIATLVAILLTIIGTGVWMSFPEKVDRNALRKKPLGVIAPPGKEYVKERTPQLISKFAINNARKKAGLPPIGEPVFSPPKRGKTIMELFDHDKNNKLEGEETKQAEAYLREEIAERAKAAAQAKKDKAEMEKFLNTQKQKPSPQPAKPLPPRATGN